MRLLPMLHERDGRYRAAVVDADRADEPVEVCAHEHRSPEAAWRCACRLWRALTPPPPPGKPLIEVLD